MGDCIEEAVLLLVSPDLSDKKNRVDHQARDEQPKEDDADYERNNLTPVKDNPAYVEEDRQGDETSQFPISWDMF